MNEEHTYKGSKTKNYFSAYLLASVQGRRKRYLEIQKKIQLAENNSDEQEYTEADLSMEEHLERKKREELLLNETQGIYPEWNEMEDKRLIQAMHLLNEKEREVMYQRVFEERDLCLQSCLYPFYILSDWHLNQMLLHIRVLAV